MVSLQVLSKKKQNLWRVYQDSGPQAPLTQEVTANLKPYLQKYLVQTKEKIKYFQLLKKKKIFSLIKYCSIFRHTQVYLGIIRYCPGIFITLCNTGMFRTLIYSEPWYNKNQGRIQNHGILRTLVYSEPWHIQKQKHISEPWYIEKHRIFRSRGILRTLYLKLKHPWSSLL